MPSSTPSQDNLILFTGARNKLYIREQFGRFQRVRRYLNLLLVGLFFGLPFLRYQGRQALLIDLSRQRLDLFGTSLYPQDLLIVAFLFILAAFLLFLVTKLYGRIWCGYTCPQTVWTLMFNWVERRIEGSHNHSRALDRAPWGWNKLGRKGLKHLLWLGIALATALGFMGYFVPVAELYPGLLAGESSPLVQGWVLFFTLCTYGNAGWLRERVCQHICPYARFQSVMFDATTSLVSYDSNRGEGRGPRRVNGAKPEALGDCVDCNLCVQVCPVGIDIRDGLQYECINCGLCVDACNQTMDRFGYPRELIGYRSESGRRLGFGGYLGYAVAVLVTLLVISFWGEQRRSFEVNVLRDRQALYRINDQGLVENTYRFKLLNKSQAERTYAVIVQGFYGLTIEGADHFTLAPGEHQTQVLTVALTQEADQWETPIRFVVVDIDTGEYLFRPSTFYAERG
ncbi:cytochrome c oxidase accessory protein CcoG [Ferrimonas sediminicola]|uniref:Cytochrome c oxidase accessory protein CcoG n=1 Tax=Ferrimonas sediminicola TaxID=2569538 RepID=A0A4U1BGK8_9GAMM|nr:cytochrome c oxidase accessory protein CcoG [Ferrimonas sediminicola]TKB50468.1 cytochrome c oxidase accessory protein CcoG [Ferrimonas sediminicola]